MKKSIYLLLILTTLILGSCKKACNFPKYEDGKYCTDIRESLIGYYKGASFDTSIVGTFMFSQIITAEVGEDRGDFTHITAYGLSGTIDAQENITFPYQACLQAQTVPYHASGTGFFSDTLLNGQANKALTMRIHYVPDSIQDANFVFSFFGVR